MTTRDFLEHLVRDDQRLDDLVLDDENRIAVIQRLLIVSTLALVVHGAAVGLTASFLGTSEAQAQWMGDWPALTVPLRLCAAFLLALVVCLPSFWFFTQLSGLDASFRLIVAQALRVQGRTSVLLLGALPIYVAIALGSVVGVMDSTAWIIRVGIAMPFVVGIAGLVSLHQSFARMAVRLPTAHVPRPRFVSRIVVAWSVLYGIVCPIALARIGEVLADWM